MHDPPSTSLRALERPLFIAASGGAGDIVLPLIALVTVGLARFLRGSR